MSGSFRAKTEFKIGKNAIDNWGLYDKANKEDWWFHFDAFSGAHLYISAEEISQEAILNAARILKEKSKYKTRKKVVVVYTQRKNILKGKSPGEVRFKNKKKCQYIAV